MKLNIVSDLHVDHGGMKELPGGDVLLLAGDVCDGENMDKVSGWLQNQALKYDRAYMIPGNHEFYGSNLLSGVKDLRHALPSNIHLLDDEVAVLDKNTMLFGGTMWTDMDNIREDVMQQAHSYMADYACIRGLTPFMTTLRFLDTMTTLTEAMAKHPNKRFVVMTHHAPSKQSVHPRFSAPVYAKVNHAFVSDLDRWIKSTGKGGRLPLWVHGHVHNSFDYVIGKTRVVANPHGYGYGNAENRSFNPAFTVEI